MFKLRLLTAFAFILINYTFINGADGSRSSNFWQDWQLATWSQKVGIGMALFTGYEFFLPENTNKTACEAICKDLSDSTNVASPTAVTQLFSPHATMNTFGTIARQVVSAAGRDQATDFSTRTKFVLPSVPEESSETEED